jgi:transglutaminase-like putative cysteine protease
VRYLVTHETHLRFARPIREHHCELRLTPPATPHQRVHSVRLAIDPEAPLHEYVDGFGNRVHHFDVAAPHEALTTRVNAEVETLLANPFDYTPIPASREAEWIASELRRAPRLWDYVLHRSSATPAVAEVALPPGCPSHAPGHSVLESAQATMQWVASTLEYRTGVTHAHSSLAHALEARAGVCQDFAHLLITVVRSWGIPARYVMGYVDPGYAPGGGGAGQAPHAWAEVLIPGAGWRGLDPVQRLVADSTYIVVARGRDSRDAAPQRGSFKGDDGGEAPDVTLSVQRQQ